MNLTARITLARSPQRFAHPDGTPFWVLEGEVPGLSIPGARTPGTPVFIILVDPDQPEAIEALRAGDTVEATGTLRFGKDPTAPGWQFEPILYLAATEVSGVKGGRKPGPGDLREYFYRLEGVWS